MARAPFPHPGCFNSSYPDAAWRPVPCAPPPPHHLTPRNGPPREIVGNGTDFSALLSAGSISRADGSFDNVVNVMSEDDSASGPNAFSLQLNTSFFPTPACAAPCQGFQQFAYMQGYGVFIEYWLLGYGPTCPPGNWQSALVTDCVGDSKATPVPPLPVSSLSQLSLTGVVAGGSEATIFWVGLQAYGVSNLSILNLQGSWREAEFNVFGENNGSQANFNVGSKITVRTSVEGPPATVPTVACDRRGFTGETNNLILVGPCLLVFAPGQPPAIVFTERLMGPVPAGSPFVSSPSPFEVFSSVYNNQQHFMYRDTTQNVQDMWYDGNGGWQLQQLTGTSPTLGNEPIVANAGPPPAGDVFVSVYGNQQHVMYRDASNNIQDVWWDGNANRWNLQQRTGTAPDLDNEPIVNNAGPPSASDIFVSVYGNQQHAMYRGASNNVQDVWYDGRGWNLQQLTGTSPDLAAEPIVSNAGPPAAGTVFVSVYGNQQHAMYRDAANNLQDVWYDGHGWNLQQLTGISPDLGAEPIVNNAGPAAASDVFVSVYGNQQHVMYRDAGNNIQDVWYDGNHGSWNLQQLTGTGPTGDYNNEPVVNNAGPPPAGAIFVSVYNNQQHVTYRDKDNNVQDVWYNPNSGWNLQQLSQPPLTINNEFLVNSPGPNSSGNIFTSVYYDQQHFTYRDTNNNIQDLWYNGAGWHLQQLAGD